jgi:hypothetical protein
MTPPHPGLPPPYTLELDLRGEMLTWREAERVATIICTFGGDPCLVPRTLEGWWYPRERRSVPMTPEERTALLGRIAAHCRQVFGMSRLTIEA